MPVELGLKSAERTVIPTAYSDRLNIVPIA